MTERDPDQPPGPVPDANRELPDPGDEEPDLGDFEGNLNA